MTLHIYPLGEQALLVAFKQEVSPAVNRNVHAFADRLQMQAIPGVVRIVPAFASCAVFYDPSLISFETLCESVHAVAADSARRETAETTGRTYTLPVVYGGAAGPDLPEVAARAGLAEEEVIRIHSSPDYHVYMLGFTGCVPYCGEVDERLSLPRRDTPRIRVEAGSIAIADRLTIVYTIASPGGWHVIGRTPMRLFDPEAARPTPLSGGDRLRFKRITEAEAAQWDEQAQIAWDETWNS